MKSRLCTFIVKYYLYGEIKTLLYCRRCNRLCSCRFYNPNRRFYISLAIALLPRCRHAVEIAPIVAAFRGLSFRIVKHRCGSEFEIIRTDTNRDPVAQSSIIINARKSVATLECAILDTRYAATNHYARKSVATLECVISSTHFYRHSFCVYIVKVAIETSISI